MMRIGLDSPPRLDGDSISPRGARDLLVSILMFAVAFWSQRWVLALPLTAIDTMPTLVAAEAHGVWEFLEVLTRELRGDATTGGYYRPLTLMTYTLDQWVWGGTPWGYHFTDVTLHAWAVVAVYWLARVAVDLPRRWAVLAAGTLLIHPAIIEVVPAIARREEALMVIGFCLAVIGGRFVPRRAGWLLMMLGSLIAVTSVERGLSVPGIVFWYLLFYRFGGLELWPRVRDSVLWTLPVGLLAVAFFLLRGWLHGTGGIDPSPLGFYYIPLAFGMMLLYPQQFIDIVAPSGATMGLLYLAVATIFGAMFAVPVLTSRRRSLVWFALGWVATYVALISVAGMFFPWYAYPAVPALGLVIAFFGAEVRSMQPGSIRTKIRSALAAAAALVLLTALLVPSPLIRDYPAWRVGSTLSERFLDELATLGQSSSTKGPIVIINLPAHYTEANADYLVTRSAAILWPSSVEVWCRANLEDADIRMIGCANFVAETTIPEIEFTEDAVRIYFVEGSSIYTNAYRDWPDARKLPESVGRGYEFPWPSEERQASSPRIYVFDGERLVPFEV